MAKVTITFEDLEDGTQVLLESDPPFPGPAAEDQTVTQAQLMGMKVIEILNQMDSLPDEEYDDESGCGHDHDHDCQHDHDH